MREPDIMFEPMKRLLETKGYQILSMNKGREPGADITAERDGRRLIVEMKGDSAALDVDLRTGIFQLFRHIRAGSDEDYALGISEAYVRLVRQVEDPKKTGHKSLCCQWQLLSTLEESEKRPDGSPRHMCTGPATSRNEGQGENA